MTVVDSQTQAIASTPLMADINLILAWKSPGKDLGWDTSVPWFCKVEDILLPARRVWPEGCKEESKHQLSSLPEGAMHTEPSDKKR